MEILCHNHGLRASQHYQGTFWHRPYPIRTKRQRAFCSDSQRHLSQFWDRRLLEPFFRKRAHIREKDRVFLQVLDWRIHPSKIYQSQCMLQIESANCQHRTKWLSWHRSSRQEAIDKIRPCSFRNTILLPFQSQQCAWLFHSQFLSLKARPSAMSIVGSKESKPDHWNFESLAQAGRKRLELIQLQQVVQTREPLSWNWNRIRKERTTKLRRFVRWTKVLNTSLSRAEITPMYKVQNNGIRRR